MHGFLEPSAPPFSERGLTGCTHVLYGGQPAFNSEAVLAQKPPVLSNHIAKSSYFLAILNAAIVPDLKMQHYIQADSAFSTVTSSD